MPGWARGLGSIGLSVASIALVFAVGELVCRALDVRGWHEPRTRGWKHARVADTERIPGVAVQFKPYSVVQYDYDSNPRRYFDAKNGLTYHMNRWGFRGADCAMRKQPGTKRIVVLGDSFTFGEGVRLQDTFCSRLETLLRHDLGEPVEVLNFGISGWATRDEILFYERMCAFFKPDLTIVAYVLNDADHAGGLDVWDNFRLQYECKSLRRSYFASWIYASVKRRLVAQRYMKSLVQSAHADRSKWDESFAYLSTGRRIAAANGSRYLVALFPFMYSLDDHYPFLSLHQMVGGYCRQDSIPFLDLFPAFKGHPYTDLWVHPTDQHPNEIGHRLAAEALSRHIQSAMAP